MKQLLFWLFCASLALSQQALGADALKPGGSSFGADDATFLPVEEAYQLYPRRKEDKLLLEWVIAPGYYLYQERFAAAVVGGRHDGRALELRFEPGVTRYDDYYEKEVEVYYETTTVEVALERGVDSGYLRVESQGCADAGLCYPPRTLYVPLAGNDPSPPVLQQLPDSAAGTPAMPAGDPHSEPSSQNSLPLVLVFALAGGLILNLMPCVFPVLSIKVLSLSQHHLSPHGRHVHGLVYSLGVVASFVAIAVGLIALRAGGEALGWGFQLQSPGFIAALIYLFFIMGLSFSGYFEAGTRLMNLGNAAAGGEGLQHSFFAGVLATVVASPCTAPFMGTALGFALTQNASVALLVFAFLGLGMALPFLMLTWMPGLLARIPRPGPWMEKLKNFLAFPLYLTAIWLLWILGNQTDTAVTALVLCGLTLLALAIWLGKSDARPARVAAAFVFVAAVLLPVRALVSKDEAPIWQPYTPQRLDSLLERDQAVFVNLTADWCITCLANEKVALNSESFRDTLEREEITYLKGDWTNRNPDITALLNANARSGVPLYLFYSAGQREPVILPQILTPAIVNRTLSRD